MPPFTIVLRHLPPPPPPPQLFLALPKSVHATSIHSVCKASLLCPLWQWVSSPFPIVEETWRQSTSLHVLWTFLLCTFSGFFLVFFFKLVKRIFNEVSVETFIFLWCEFDKKLTGLSEGREHVTHSLTAKEEENRWPPTVPEQCSIRLSRRALIMHKAKRTSRQIPLLPSVSRLKWNRQQIRQFRNFGQIFKVVWWLTLIMKLTVTANFFSVSVLPCA